MERPQYILNLSMDLLILDVKSVFGVDATSLKPPSSWLKATLLSNKSWTPQVQSYPGKVWLGCLDVTIVVDWDVKQQNKQDWFGGLATAEIKWATSGENVSLEIFDRVRFKPACSATETS